MKFAKSQRNENNILSLYDGESYKMLNVLEWERLQTLKEDYTKGVSESKRKSLIGDGWTIDVIVNIFRGLLNEKELEINDGEKNGG